MEIGLCMVVKDEARRIVDCLEPIHDLFDDVAIVDTGSTDGTPALLARRFGVRALQRSLDPDRCDCLCDPRRAALEALRTPWILMLDADERLARSSLERLVAMPGDTPEAGYFGRWINHVPGDAFEDYKLFLFRTGFVPVGLVHDVVQHDIRRQGHTASWLPGLVIEHRPDALRFPQKATRYRQRLMCALAQQPEYQRYRWFLGYMDFREQRPADASHHLQAVIEAASTAFPVETLNSAMVLAELHARAGDGTGVERTVRWALGFHAAVERDFEVAVNLRLRPWLDRALDCARSGHLEAVRAYRFAC